MTDQEPILHRVESETHGAFRVAQITRGTALEDFLGLDLVTIPAGMTTEFRRHLHAENVVYILSGDATAIIGHVGYRVVEGDRLRSRPPRRHPVRVCQRLLTQPRRSRRARQIDVDLS